MNNNIKIQLIFIKNNNLILSILYCLIYIYFFYVKHQYLKRIV